jgi:hypothetical protein
MDILPFLCCKIKGFTSIDCKTINKLKKEGGGEIMGMGADVDIENLNSTIRCEKWKRD